MSRVKNYTSMVGKTYLYMGNQHTIRKVARDGKDRIQLTTDKTILKVRPRDLTSFLPVHKETDPEIVAQSRALVRADNSALNDLGTTLLETIEVIKKNPGYVHQAKQINAAAKTLIDLKRLQLDVIKTIKGR